MTGVAARHLETRRTNPASRFVVFVTVLAFAFQSFVAQTHIHNVPQGAGGAFKLFSAEVPAHGKSPFDHSRSDCPLCQAVAHADAYLVPGSSVLLLSVWAWHESPFVTAYAPAVASAHNWQSRAPPHR